MYEDLKRNLDKAMLLFTKVYVYHTNTKKPWNELTPKQMNDTKFKWACGKWFMLSNDTITSNQVKTHIKSCPELVEDADKILKNNNNPFAKWKQHSEWYNIYEAYPIKGELELKLLINTIGLRMLHFVNNKR